MRPDFSKNSSGWVSKPPPRKILALAAFVARRELGKLHRAESRTMFRFAHAYRFATDALHAGYAREDVTDAYRYALRSVDDDLAHLPRETRWEPSSLVNLARRLRDGMDTAERVRHRAAALRKAKRRGDPNREIWGPQALVFGKLDEAFLRAVRRYKNCAVFIDEATISIDRDAAFTDLFTRSRHAGHIIIVMGHRATVLLPIQRDQFGSLFLFRQSPGAAKIWAEEWAEIRIHDATGLKKYEFLYCKKFGAPDGSHLIQKGKFPPP